MTVHPMQAQLDTLKAHQHHAGSQWFHWFACECGRLAGKPAAFILAAAIILTWAVTGPLFGYSDTWQLVINTATTIITFLMVFLIQHSQNRDTLALQVKLSELVLALQGARNELAAAEQLDEEELAELHRRQGTTAMNGGTDATWRQKDSD